MERPYIVLIDLDETIEPGSDLKSRQLPEKVVRAAAFSHRPTASATP
jgi:hypothetical protein